MARRHTVTDAVIAVLRHVGKVVVAAVPTVLVARLGLPALGGLVFLAVLVLGAVCWVLRSDARVERVSRVLLAWRGNADCLPPAARPAPAPPVPRGRRFLLRRS